MSQKAIHVHDGRKQIRPDPDWSSIIFFSNVGESGSLLGQLRGRPGGAELL